VESSDTIVITKAQEIDAILLSLNGDFSHIVNVSAFANKGPGLISLFSNRQASVNL